MADIVDSKSLQGGDSIETELQELEDEIIEETEATEELEEEEDFYTNLVVNYTKAENTELARSIIEEYQINKDASENFFSIIRERMKLLGLGTEEGVAAFQGACQAHHPLILESAVKFQSKHSPELFPASGAVKTVIMGEKTEEKQQRANRIKSFFNYQINYAIPGYIEEKERLLFAVPIIGTAFSKSYYNPQFKTICSEFVAADELIAPFHCKTLEACNAYTHRLTKTKMDFDSAVDSGFYVIEGEVQESAIERTDLVNEMDRVTGSDSDTDKTEGYTLLEHYVYLEDEDGEIKPFIATVHPETSQVISIYRNWKEGDPQFKRLEWFVKYDYVPGFNFYSFGLLHLLGSVQITLTAVLRALVDSGQFANMQGGFKLKGVKFSGPATSGPIAPGEFRDIESTLDDVSKAFFPLPFKEPSNVLYNMLTYLESRGQRFADAAEQVIQEASNYGPVGTTVALLDASSKFQTSLTRRLYRSLTKEYRIFYRLNSESLDDEYPYSVIGGDSKIFKDDFDDSVEVVPVADPAAPTQTQRAALAAFKMQILQYAGETVNKLMLIRELLLNADPNSDVDKIAPLPKNAEPLDPLSDIQQVSQGNPIKAFPGQDHESHIAVKRAFMQNPLYAANPELQQVGLILQANIKEHLILKFTEEMNALSGGNKDEAIMAMAAQKLQKQGAMLAQMEAQGGFKSPDQMLAEAEQMKAQNDRMKVEGDQILDLIDLMIKHNKVNIDAIKADASIEQGDKDRMVSLATTLIDNVFKAQQKKVDKQSR